MAALKRRADGGIRFAGLGGVAMEGQGLQSLFPMSDISVMGLFEVLPRLPGLMRRIRETADEILRVRPDVVVSIDSPAFCFRVWRRLRGSGIPLVHYVAPSVWAWRPGRARKFAGAIQHLLALLPFEPPYFEREGLDCTFVGHPVIESGAELGDGAAFRADHGLGDGPVLGVLAGSRRGEAGRLLAPFGAAAALLAPRYPDLRLVVPTVPAVADLVRDAVADWPGAPVVVTDPARKFDAMAACDVALAASGTVALELGLVGVPMVVGYRLNFLTSLVARRLIRVEYACLINLLLGRSAVPELMLGDCRPERLAAEISGLLDDESAREAQRIAGREALGMLRPDGVLPSERAAEVVLGLTGNTAPVGGGTKGEKT